MATRYRYVYKKSKATYTYNTNTTITDLNVSGDNVAYPYSNVYIVTNFTCSALSVIANRYSASSYLSKRGEEFRFTLNSFKEDYGSQIEVGYDDETGEYDYEYRHTIPAGSYFVIGDYLDSGNTNYAYYSDFYEDYRDELNLAQGLLYASTQVVFDSYDSYYTDDDGYENWNGVFNLVSGTVKLVVPSVSYSTYSYSYFSSDSDKYVKTFHYGRTYTSGNSSYVNQPTLFDTWQFTYNDPNYAYCPVVLPSTETDLNMDPLSVALSNTSPTAGSAVNAVVTPSSTALDYGTYTYTYQYSINGGSTWTTIGTTADTTKSFTVPSSATQIKVRVQVSDGIGFTSTNYITSPNYTVNKYTNYAGVGGAVKGVSPVVCVGGSIKTSVTTKKCVNGVVKS